MGRRLYGSGVLPRPAAAAAPRIARVAAWVATALAATALAFVLAQGFWRLAGPMAVAAPAAPWPDSTVAAFAGAPLFGGGATGPVAERVAPRVAAGALGEIRLLGIIAGRDGAGHALFRVADRGPVLVASGQDVAPGVRLDAVLADRVRLSGNDEVREVLLRQPVPLATRAVAAPAPAPATRAAAGERTACAPPAGFKGPVYRINAELLSGMAAQPQSWNGALGESEAGLVVREAGGFAAMLGLKPGDRLREANGIALSARNDLLTAVVRPLQASQPVRVQAAREGAPLELLLVNASACAAR